jgi:signal transduction histidine kinase
MIFIVGDGFALKDIELGSTGFTYVFRNWTSLGVGSNNISPWGGASIIGEGAIIIKWTNNDKGLKDYKIHIISSIHHIFCINFWWITKNFLKVYRFYQILHFVLKNYLNFKLYEDMLILFYDFFSCLIKYNFALYFVYITPHLHVIKDFWNFKILFNRFLVFKKFKFHKFQIEFFFEYG